MNENAIINELRQRIHDLEVVAEDDARTKAEMQALRERLTLTETLLSNIVESNPIPTFILDRHHRVLYWNQTLEKISGIKAADVLGTTGQWRAFYDSPRPVMADLVIDGVDEGTFWGHYKNNTEYTTLQKSDLKEGAYESQDFFPKFGRSGMWMSAAACPLTDEAGQIIGAIETFQDVTRLINAQMESKKNEEKYRSLFENSGDALFLMDYDRVIDCNALSLDLMNCAHRDILNHSIFDFCLQEPRSREMAEDLFRQKIVKAYEGRTQRFYWQFISRPDRLFYAHVTLNCVAFSGRFVLQALIRDITEQVRTEKELAGLRNYLSSIIHSMPSMLIGIDRSGCITHFNRKATELTGFKEEAARGRILSDILPRFTDSMDVIRSAIQRKTVLEQLRIPFEKGDAILYEDLTVYPLSGEGLEGAVVRIDDVTDRVQMEEMMIQTEKMMSVGSLAAGMAHELNNPLAGMMQSAQVMIHRLSARIPANERVADELGVGIEAIHEYMARREILSLAETINDSGKRAAEIIRNMLSFARKSEPRKKTCRVSQILDKTIEIAGSDYDLINNYDFRQIRVERDYDPRTPPVLCEESKIQQVFWNILKNGAEAMRGRDTPAVFHLRVYPRDDHVYVEIEDNGPGMDKEVRKRVFEPFFTTKSPLNGTGLGLAVSYFIIAKDHGGKISVDSETGVGTRFVIQFKTGLKTGVGHEV